MKARILLHGAAVLTLIATVAAAQTPPNPKNSANAPKSQSADRDAKTPSASEREVSSGMATGRRSGSVIVLDREAQTGMATGRRQHQPILTVADKSLGSAHATESVTAPATDAEGGNTQKASSSPMYKDNTKSGDNPLFESKDKQAAQKPGTSHETVEYKDGEDMTTRYRPGNNKTSKANPTGEAATPKH